MPSSLNEPLLPACYYDVANFEKPESPRDEISFFRTMKRTFPSLLVSFLSVFVNPSLNRSCILFVPSSPQGLQGYIRIGESHPLSLILQARARKRESMCMYVCSRPFSSRFDVHPGQDIFLVLELPSTRRSGRKRAVYPHVPPINQNPLRLNYRETRP